MTTYSLAGSFGWAGGGKAGATVDIWATSRFSGVPAENQSPPTGNPDAGPVITGPNFGSPGAYEITGIVILQDYYVRVQYGGNTYWGTRTAASLGGQTTESVSVNVQASSYTLTLADAGNIVEMDVGSANTLTIPPDSAVTWPAVTIIEVSQTGTGVTTITPGAGVTVNSTGGNVMAQWVTISLRYRGSSTWLLTGATT
jgi:hypothetical protein